MVEPVFGIIKEQQGGRRFLLRGLTNVAAEWTVLATAFNLRTLWRVWGLPHIRLGTWAVAVPSPWPPEPHRACSIVSMTRAHPRCSTYPRSRVGMGRSRRGYRPLDPSNSSLPFTYWDRLFLRFQADEGLADRQGMTVSRKRVQRLMRIMGLRAIYRQPRTSQPVPERRVYPYLLRDLTIYLSSGYGGR